MADKKEYPQARNLGYRPSSSINPTIAGPIKMDKRYKKPLSPKQRGAVKRIKGDAARSRINKATDAYRNRAADGTEGASRAKATRMAPKPVIGEAARPRGPSAYQIAKQRATRRARRRPAPPNRRAPGSR